MADSSTQVEKLGKLKGFFNLTKEKDLKSIPEKTAEELIEWHKEITAKTRLIRNASNSR